MEIHDFRRLAVEMPWIDLVERAREPSLEFVKQKRAVGRPTFVPAAVPLRLGSFPEVICI